MGKRRVSWLVLLGGTAVVLLLGLRRPSAAQPPSFDKLVEADRKVLGERFQREIWPLLVRGGKDGCVGCHTGKTALRFAGDADKNFRMLLREGFFLKDDDGSLLSRINDTNKKRVMPPGNRPHWTAAEKRLLSDFVEAVHQKQKS